MGSQCSFSRRGAELKKKKKKKKKSSALATGAAEESGQNVFVFILLFLFTAWFHATECDSNKLLILDHSMRWEKEPVIVHYSMR